MGVLMNTKTDNDGSLLAVGVIPNIGLFTGGFKLGDRNVLFQTFF